MRTVRFWKTLHNIIVKQLENQIICKKSLGASKPKGLDRIDKFVKVTYVWIKLTLDLMN